MAVGELLPSFAAFDVTKKMTENSNCPILSLRSINWTTIGTKGESLAMPIAQMDGCLSGRQIPAFDRPYLFCRLQ